MLSSVVFCFFVTISSRNTLTQSAIKHTLKYLIFVILLCVQLGLLIDWSHFLSFIRCEWDCLSMHCTCKRYLIWRRA